MRMKSILAISALSAGTFLTSITYAASAPAPQTQEQITVKEKEVVEQTPALDPTEKETTQNAATTTTSETNEPAAPPQTSSRSVHKKSHKHKKHRKHKKHHRGHHHHHHHDKYCPPYGDECPPVSVCKEIPNYNFLLGGSLGYVVQKENFITNYTAPIPAGNPGGVALPIPGYTSESEKINEQGVLFGLLAGWQWRCHRWMLGIEGNIDFSSDFEQVRQFVDQELNNDILTGTLLYERGTIYALTTRLGYFVTPFFMPYVRAGAQMSRDEVNYQALIGLAGLQVPDFSSRKKDVYGYVLGIGAEFPTYIGASTIRFEYNFVRTDSVIIEDSTFPIVGNHKFRYPESHVGKIAWIWNFL